MTASSIATKNLKEKGKRVAKVSALFSSQQSSEINKTIP